VYYSTAEFHSVGGFPSKLFLEVEFVASMMF